MGCICFLELFYKTCPLLLFTTSVMWPDLPLAVLLCLQNPNSFHKTWALCSMRMKKVGALGSHHVHWINLVPSAEQCLREILTRPCFGAEAPFLLCHQHLWAQAFQGLHCFPVCLFPAIVRPFSPCVFLSSDCSKTINELSEIIFIKDFVFSTAPHPTLLLDSTSSNWLGKLRQYY